MDPELIAYLDERFRGIDASFSQQIQDLREETSQRFDTVDKRLEQMDEQLRLTGVRVEGLQGQIQLVAEGVAAGNEKVDSFKVEVAREFSDTKALIQNGYRDLDKRVKVLERRARIS
jgi:hypothetical protein